MTYHEFLNTVIDNGIEAAKASYGDERSKSKLEGSIAGFFECKGRTPEELVVLLADARQAASRLYMGKDDDAYWSASCFAAEVEWVCNCISAILMNEGRPTIVTPTAKGVITASRILAGGEVTGVT